MLNIKAVNGKSSELKRLLNICEHVLSFRKGSSLFYNKDAKVSVFNDV